MNNPTRHTNRSKTMGAKFALLALLTGIAVTSPAWLIGRAGEKHHADKHKDKHKGEKHHGEKHHGEKRQGTEYRWDLIHLTSQGTNTFLDAGGNDYAKAADGSYIRLTGSGKWITISGHEEPEAATGGGAWMAFDSTGTNSTGSGTYAVTGGVAFTVVPGSTPAAGTIDSIGNPDDSRSGLLILRVRYSDGEDGVLTVSCHGGGAVPETIFEGITATKGFVGYVDRGKPEAGVDQNRTAFHVLAEGQVDCDHDDDDDDDDD